MSKLVKNYILSVIYNLSAVILPLISIPYISRVLGKKGIGIYAFTTSITQYFLMLALFGTAIYGIRTIARVRDDVGKRSKTFWSIFLLKLIISIISISIFIVSIVFLNIEYKYLYFIQLLSIVAVLVDVSWLFIGMEDLKKIVVRDIIFKILTVVLFLTVVKNRNDIWKYILIIAGGNFINKLSLWISVGKYIKFKKIILKDILSHFLPNLKLFLPQIVGRLYIYVDQTMLGIIINKSEVGLYNRATRIISISMNLITALGVVMIPRISNYYAKGDDKKVKKYLSLSFSFLSFLSIAITFGLAGIAGNFVPLFLGHEFVKVKFLLYFLAPMVIFTAWSEVIGSQLMISLSREKEYSISIMSGFITNVVLNIFLIPHFQSLGAVIASVISRIVIFFTQLVMVRKFLPYRKMAREMWKYFIAAVTMFSLVYITGNFISNKIVALFIQLIIGFSVYVLFNFLFKSSILFLIFNKIKNRNKQ